MERIDVRDVLDTPTRILEAAAAVLGRDGFAHTTTRKVADAAGVPLSQIHYHFGSHRGLMLGVLRRENTRLVARQATMFESDDPVWRQWAHACDFYDQDLSSGYVHVLQEMIAAGRTEPEIAAEVSTMLAAWLGLLERVAHRASAVLGGFGGLLPADVGRLVCAAWLGAEALHLLRPEDAAFDLRATLRRVGQVIREREEGGPP